MKIFGKIFVSTDSKKIMKIVKKLKNIDTINRPKKLSDDFTGTREVIVHAIKEVSKIYNFTKVYCVYPTSVFLKKKNLLSANKILKEKNYIFSASSVNKS